MKEGVGWGDAGKRKQGFRGSPSLAQYQASQRWWLEHPESGAVLGGHSRS